jgi:hypothetical protein
MLRREEMEKQRNNLPMNKTTLFTERSADTLSNRHSINKSVCNSIAIVDNNVHGDARIITL